MRGWKQTGALGRGWAAGGLLLMAALLGGCQRSRPVAEPAAGSGAPRLTAATDSAVCQPCHAELYEDWKRSAHYYNMDLPRPDTVLGDFERNNVLEFEGTRSRMFRQDGRYFMEYTGPDGKTGVHAIDYVMGAARQQIYLHRRADGRIQILPSHWSVTDGRWEDAWHSPLTHLPKPIPVIHPFYWSNYARTYNMVCMECHSSQPRKQYDPERDTFDSTFDPKVNCAACHGDAQEHVRAQGHPATAAADRSLLRLQELPTQDAIDLCMNCHARKIIYREGFEPGQSIYDYFVPNTWDPDLYFADGRRSGTVYNYMDFLQSACYRRSSERLDCSTTCHPPHGLKFPGQTVDEANRQCTRCHRKWEEGLTAHTFHSPVSAGSRCTACHMPTLNLVGTRLVDHTISVPLPELTRQYAIPNACNLCHTSDSTEWAEGWVERWYGNSPTFQAYRVRLRDRTRVLTAIFQEQARPVPDLVRWLDDTGETVVQRASAANFLADAKGDPRALAALLRHRTDTHPLVRFYVVGALAGFPEARDALRDALRDRFYTIRGRAYEALYMQQPEIRNEQDPVVARVRAEFEERNRVVRSDNPQFLSEVALWHLGRGEIRQAEELLRQAVARTAPAVDMQFNLVQFLLQQGRLGEVEVEIRQLEAIAPDSVEAATMRAQLLLALGRPAEALALIEGRAARGQSSELLRAMKQQATWHLQAGPLRELGPAGAEP